MRSGNTTPLCAIEDWSGAGFHTKQPLNVGQPTVSQVVSSPNNQSCLDPTKGNTPSVSRPNTTHKQQQPRKAAPRTTTTFIGKREREEAPARWIVVGLLLVVVVLLLFCRGMWGERRGAWEQRAGMANRQVRARFYCHGLEVSLGGGDAPKAAPPGVEPVNPLWSSRFLLMQTHAGYRSA